jgi:hypothetical protein
LSFSSYPAFTILPDLTIESNQGILCNFPASMKNDFPLYNLEESAPKCHIVTVQVM